MTAELVFAKLKDGAKTYGQLRGVCENLDYVLGTLLKSRQIVMYYADNLPARYGIPIVVTDEPLRPILHLKKPLSPKRQRVYGPTQICKRCGLERKIQHFGFGRPGERKSTCYSCCRKRTNENKGRA